MRERREEKAARARRIIDRLGEAWPEAHIALEFASPYQLMVAVVLSAQCTDARVNLVTPAVFRRWPTPEALAAAGRAELEEQIRSCGLFRSKARALVSSCEAIVREHGGRVPERRAELVRLPGIGNKSAGVIAMHLSGEQAFPVDTHVARLAGRLGLSARTQPDDIERDLRALLPPELWGPAHHRLIWHGRGICVARAPLCSACPVRELCPRRGVKESR